MRRGRSRTELDLGGGERGHERDAGEVLDGRAEGRRGHVRDDLVDDGGV